MTKLIVIITKNIWSTLPSSHVTVTKLFGKWYQITVTKLFGMVHKRHWWSNIYQMILVRGTKYLVTVTKLFFLTFSYHITFY